MKKIFSLSFILLFMVLGSMAQKNAADTSKWNGVWDPTDPKCPCYDIQKQAEKEYQGMLKKEQKDDALKNNTISKDTTLGEEKRKGDKTGLSQEDSTIKGNRTDNSSRAIKHKADKKRKKRERKYKRGKAVCPEV